MSDNLVEFVSNGRKFRFRSHSPDEYIISCIRDDADFYEWDLLTALAYLPLPEGSIIDVGANLGNHSVYFARCLNRSVQAYEMDPQNYKFLLENIEANAAQQLVQAYNVAIADRIGRAHFVRDPKNSGASKREAVTLGSQESVDMLPLDQIELDGKVALIKIDVEGDELDVLRGSRRVLGENKPVLVVEVPNAAAYHSIYRFVRDFEYQPIMIGAKTDTCVFVHRSIAADCNDKMVFYYTRRFEKLGSRAAGDALAFAKEFSRIKGLLSKFYSDNYELRRSLREAQSVATKFREEVNLWQAATSSLCAGIQSYSEGQGKLPPAKITAIRNNISSTLSTRITPADLLPKPVVKLGVTPQSADLFSVLVVVCAQLSKHVILQAERALHICRIKANILYFSSEPPIDEEIANSTDFKLFNDRRDIFTRLNEHVESNNSVLVVDFDSGIHVGLLVQIILKSAENDPSADIIAMDGISFNTHSDKIHQNLDRYITLDLPTSQTVQVFSPLSLNFLLRRRVAELAMRMKMLQPSNKGAPVEAALGLAAARLGLIVQVPQRDRLRQQAKADEWKALSNFFGGMKRRPKPAARRTNVDVAVVGRLAPERWQRGGIYHSNQAYGMLCEHVGLNYVLVEIDQEPTAILNRVSDASVVFIYTGDQHAQDFFNVEMIVKALDQRGQKVLVNLSYDSHPIRTQEILNLLSQTSERVNLMAFSDISNDPSLSCISDRIVVVPKTIKQVPVRDIRFESTSGVFLGDIGKFLNTRITENPEVYYKQIEASLPDVKINFVQQYTYKGKLPDWIESCIVHPYDEKLSEHFCKCRLYVHPQNFCTFEMLPVEAMLAGLPVVYRDMPQSLNKYVGDAGIKFSTPTELGRALHKLYNSKDLWETYRKLGIGKSEEFSVDNTAARFEKAILQIIHS